MKQYLRSILTALICFAVIIVLNFALPRLLPGDPVAYLSGCDLNSMTAEQVAYYREALHLDDSAVKQFIYYLESIFDGSLGYSYKKGATVSSLIGERLSFTLQITLPAVLITSLLGLIWGMNSGYKKNTVFDRISSSVNILVNSFPVFLIAFLLIIALPFPRSGLNSIGVLKGSFEYFTDRLYHLVLPVTTIVLSTLPSRFLIVRNSVRKVCDEKYILYARERGLSDKTIKYKYILKNIAQPFISMTGISVSLCIGGSLVVENIFSINGMGKLLTDAVYSLDYPLMQGILFVTAFIMLISIIVTDIICIMLEPKARKGASL